eukprot:1194866-Prorocentrum_minimum.AAC.5
MQTNILKEALLCCWSCLQQLVYKCATECVAGWPCLAQTDHGAYLVEAKAVIGQDLNAVEVGMLLPKLNRCLQLLLVIRLPSDEHQPVCAKGRLGRAHVPARHHVEVGAEPQASRLAASENRSPRGSTIRAV